MAFCSEGSISPAFSTIDLARNNAAKSDVPGVQMFLGVLNFCLKGVWMTGFSKVFLISFVFVSEGKG